MPVLQLESKSVHAQSCAILWKGASPVSLACLLGEDAAVSSSTCAHTQTDRVKVTSPPKSKNNSRLDDCISHVKLFLKLFAGTRVIVSMV